VREITRQKIIKWKNTGTNGEMVAKEEEDQLTGFLEMDLFEDAFARADKSRNGHSRKPKRGSARRIIVYMLANLFIKHSFYP
jgi:hypothetical protein